MSVTRKSAAWLIVALVVVGGIVAATTAMADRGNGDAPPGKGKVVKFDVAEDATRFVFDEAPVDGDDLPAYGNDFVTQGYIYPHGTLGESDGVLANGEPEFPEEVIGEWTCRGWFVGDGAATKTGPWVATTQLYDLGDKPGGEMLVTDGSEISDQNVKVARAITGGTGPYKDARGEGAQELLGFNESEGVNLRFELKVNTK